MFERERSYVSDEGIENVDDEECGNELQGLVLMQCPIKEIGDNVRVRQGKVVVLRDGEVVSVNIN